MFKKQNLDVIDSSLRHFYLSELSETTENLRQLVLDSPKQLSKVVMDTDLTEFNFKFRREREFICLAIMSWYFPEEIRFLVQMQLEDTWKPSQLEVKEVLLTSKDYALTWLISCSKWTERDFFGNTLDKSFARLFRLTEFKKKSVRKVPRYSGYCRGYQDTNRGVPSSLRKEHWAKLSVEEEMQREFEFEYRRFLLFIEVSDKFRDLNRLRTEKVDDRSC